MIDDTENLGMIDHFRRVRIRARLGLEHRKAGKLARRDLPAIHAQIGGLEFVGIVERHQVERQGNIAIGLNLVARRRRLHIGNRHVFEPQAIVRREVRADAWRQLRHRREAVFAALCRQVCNDIERGPLRIRIAARGQRVIATDAALDLLLVAVTLFRRQRRVAIDCAQQAIQIVPRGRLLDLPDRLFGIDPPCHPEGFRNAGAARSTAPSCPTVPTTVSGDTESPSRTLTLPKCM